MQLTGIDFKFPFRPHIFTDFSWTVPTGTVLLLGPNGAGKSTLMGLMTTTLKPQSGTITRHQMISTDQRQWRQQIGWVPQKPAALPGLSVAQQVAYAGWLQGMTQHDAESATPAALERVALADLANRRVSQLSGGEQRRLSIAGALVASPSVLVMDEPTAGLDPAQRRRFRELVTDLASAADLVISTHQTEDLSLTATHVAVITHGRLCFDGTTDDFLGRAEPGVDRSDRAQNAYERVVMKTLLE